MRILEVSFQLQQQLGDVHRTWLRLSLVIYFENVGDSTSITIARVLYRGRALWPEGEHGEIGSGRLAFLCAERDVVSKSRTYNSNQYYYTQDGSEYVVRDPGCRTIARVLGCLMVSRLVPACVRFESIGISNS